MERSDFAAFRARVELMRWMNARPDFESGRGLRPQPPNK
jgi:hypothetical protein